METNLSRGAAVTAHCHCDPPAGGEAISQFDWIATSSASWRTPRNDTAKYSFSCPREQLPVLASIVYHDILNYPLTAWECFRLQMSLARIFPERAGRVEGLREGNPSTSSGNNFGSILQELERLKREDVVTERNGFYMLAGREALYEERIERTKVAEETWHAVRRALSFLRLAPFVRAAALSGSVAMGNAAPSSDVDLLVIAEHGRVWTVRFFLTVLAIFSRRLRPGRLTRFFFPFVRQSPDGGVAGKLCLNHYLTTASLALRNRTLFGAAAYARLIPLWGGEWFKRFYSENPWIKSYMPHAVLVVQNRKTFPPQHGHEKLRSFLELILRGGCGNALESVLRRLQRLFIRRNPLSNLPGRVVAEDSELAFHPETPEAEVLDIFAQKMLELGAGEFRENR